MRDEHMCSEHGYAYLPDDPQLYKVFNPPAIDKNVLCKKCSEIMKKRGQKYPSMKDAKVWFNVTDDMTQKKLMIGRYSYMRFKIEE